MAVVPGGFYGAQISRYNDLKDSRFWNTKGYEYAVVKNAGQIDVELKKEDYTNTATNNDTLPGDNEPLLVVQNKYGYHSDPTHANGNANSTFKEDITNPIYQVRNRDGTVNNDYYVDQETGKVYFRPDQPVAPTNLQNSVSFNGGAGLIDTTPSPALNINGPLITMEAWINPTDGTGENMIMNKEGSFELAIRDGVLAMAVETTAPEAWFWTNQAGVVGTGAPPAVPLNTWSHVAATFDGTSFRLYLNGNLTQTVTERAAGQPVAGNIVPSGGNMHIGRRSGTSFFDGQIDEARVSDSNRYPTNFTPSLFPFTADGNTAGLWHFDEPVGSGTVSDSSGNGTNFNVPGGVGVIDTNPSPIIGASAVDIEMPANIYVDRNTPQFFGSEFFLDDVPNPEDFGDNGATNNISFGSNMEYSDIEVNGVKIAVGNLDTALLSSIPPLPGADDQAIFRYTNAFEAGSNLDFGTLTGTWTYDSTNGVYRNVDYDVVNDVALEAATDYRQSQFKLRTADNFIFDTDIRFDDAGTGTDDWIGVQFRQDNPADVASPPIGGEDGFAASGYLVYHKRDGTIGLIKAGVGEVATANVAAAVVGTSKNLEVRGNGSNIIVEVNGTEVINFDDITPITDGHLNISTQGTSASFDNFNLKSYNSPIQLLSRALRKGSNIITIKGYDPNRGAINVNGSIGGVNLSTNNIPPDLATLYAASGGTGSVDILSEVYRSSNTSTTIEDWDPVTAGIQEAELDRSKAYWSASTKSDLGLAGIIEFKNKEGGAIEKQKDQFSGLNSLMQNLVGIIRSQDTLFQSTLDIIR